MKGLPIRPNDWPLRVRLIVLFLLIGILPLVLLMQAFYNNSKETIVNNFTVNTKLSLEIINSKLDSLLNSLEENTVSLYADASIQSLLSRSGPASADIASYNNAMGLISSMKTRKEIQTIQIYDPTFHLRMPTQERALYDAASLANASWLKDVLALEGKTKWVGALPGNGEHLLLVSRAINDLTAFRNIGFLLLLFNEKEIRNIFLDLPEDPLQVIYIADEQGSVLSSSRAEMIGKPATEFYDLRYSTMSGFGQSSDAHHRYYHVTNEQFGWRIVNVIPNKIIENKLLQTKYFAMGLLLIGIAVIVFLSVVTSKWMTKPIIALKNLMLKVQDGDLTVRSEISGRDEIGRLSLGFNVMINRINEQMTKIYDEQQKKNELELNAMQMKINPHFLYNSLEIIKGMADRQSMTPISEMTLNLAEFYRIALSQGLEVITIRDELLLVEQYLKIQKIFLENSFDYYMEVDEEVLDCKTLKLILQPLVENSIQHGIKGLSRRGYIEVVVSSSNEAICLEITDNGHGIEGRKLAAITRSLAGYGNRHTDSYGIYNVNDRIRMYYGKNYGLQYSSVEGEGTAVKVLIGKS